MRLMGVLYKHQKSLSSGPMHLACAYAAHHPCKHSEKFHYLHILVPIFSTLAMPASEVSTGIKKLLCGVLTGNVVEKLFTGCVMEGDVFLVDVNITQPAGGVCPVCTSLWTVDRCRMLPHTLPFFKS